MKKSHKILSVIIICLSFLGLSLLVPASAFAGNGEDNDYDACAYITNEAARKAAGCDNSTGDRMSSVIVNILNGIIGAAGLVAVIFIIIGGINYMTSAGDSSKVEKGKKTIIYAAIGLAICALAFAIVNWVVAGLLGNS